MVIKTTENEWKTDHVHHGYAIGIFNAPLVCCANLHAALCTTWILWFRCFIFQCGKSSVFLHASSDGHLQILLQSVMDFHRHYLVWCVQTFIRKMHKINTIIATIGLFLNLHMNISKKIESLF